MKISKSTVENAKKIPRIVHYTFGMAADFGGKPWSLVHYVCLRSAIEHLNPEQVFFYYEYEPTGPWWELTRDLVTLKKVNAPREIYGNPLIHVAHRSDVLRLQVLIEHGGIYLDADVLVHRDFDDLLDNCVVLGREGEGGLYGTANAVILAVPNAPFLVRWLDEYRSFRSKGRDEFWSEHSVALPAKLAELYPEDITLLSEKAFFWPLWIQDHLDWIFKSARPIRLNHTYANHLWESYAWPMLEHLTPGRVRANDTNFHYWALPYLRGLPNNYGGWPLLHRLHKLRERIHSDAGRIKAKLKGLTRQAKMLAMGRVKRRREIFRDIYKHNLWGSDATSKFYSGIGSRGEAVDTYVDQMAKLIRSHAAELGRPPVVVDLGCGDFQVGKALMTGLADVTYIGCDIVPELVEHNNRVHGTEKISFVQLDMVVSPLPRGDICLVRQVLQHLSNAEILDILEKVSVYSVIYVTEGHPAERLGPVNPDKLSGADVRFNWQTGRGRGVELNESPFDAAAVEMFRTFAPPHEVIVTTRFFPKLAVRPGEIESSKQTL